MGKIIPTGKGGGCVVIHLHMHSKYSLKDSIIDFDDLTNRLKDIGQNAIALTDHGWTIGAISFYKHCLKNNIKYIHGCEMYTCNDVKIKDKNDRYSHLVLLAKNEAGRLNLNKLITISSHPDNSYYKPRIDFSILSNYSEGLICLSACLAGEIPKALMNDKYDVAKEICFRYKNLFRDDFYLEIQSRKEEKQIKLNKEIIKLSNDCAVEVVVTTDAHHVNESDRKYQQIYAFNGKYKEDGESYLGCYVQSEHEVKENLKYLSKNVVATSIANTHRIANKCNVAIPLSDPIMPKVDVPQGYDSTYDWLSRQCDGRLKERLNWSNFSESKQQEYTERLHYEIDALNKMGFIDYILLVYSYSNSAKERAPCRGSAGGSLICFLLKITDIDPIEHGLYFERFIDVGALELIENGELTKGELKIPDIDLDFTEPSRDAIVEFLKHKYGESYVASIGKFSLQHTKGTIRDICKALDEFDLELEDEIAKAFMDYELTDITFYIEEKKINQNFKPPENALRAIKYVEEYPTLFSYVEKLNNLPKSFGLHACGKIISTQELDFYIPSCYDKKGTRYLQGDMHDVEDVGLVKVDLLGLRTLSHIYGCLDMINKDYEYINPKKLNYNDKKILDVFNSGNTEGIFQMSSYGMRQTLKDMNIQGIDDLSIANALYRPGAMTHIKDFCKRRRNEQSFQYIHDDLKEILATTYGIIVFQEQLIEIGRFAGLRNSDELRVATSKKKRELLDKVQPELKEKLLMRGWTESQFDILWNSMIAFAKYSFNKSHSSGYGIIAFQTAKLKAYHVYEFFASLFNSYIGKNDFMKMSANNIYTNSQENKITFNSLNFRNDHRQCNVEDNKLNYAVPLIKDCSVNNGLDLYSLKDIRCKTFIELLLEIKKTTINSGQLKVLTKLGFFSEFGNIKELLEIIDIFKFFKNGDIKSLKISKIENETIHSIVKSNSTFTNKDGSLSKSYSIKNVRRILHECESYIFSLKIKDFSIRERIQLEQQYLGFTMLTTGKNSDRPILIVKKVIPFKTNTGYSVITKSLGSGIQTRFSVWNKTIDKCGKIEENDIILCLGKPFRNKQGYFTLNAYKHLD